jgi:hypothetical protein
MAAVAAPLQADGLRAPQTEVRSGPFIFIHWPGQAGAASALAASLDPPPALPGLPDDILDREPVIIYLPPDRATFDSLAPGVPDWSAGVAFPQGNRIVLPTFSTASGGRPLGTILRHELGHVALRRHLGDGIPRWFHEGYAQLAAGSWSAGDAWQLRLAILAGRLPALDSLSLDFRRQRLDAQDAYLLAYTAVDKLYRLGGAAGFGHLLDRWHEVGDLDRALRSSYGITLGQFEKMWREDVSDRFGWLLFLSQAAVFWAFLALLLLGLGYWKIRRNRRKLEELRASEPPDVLAVEIRGLSEEARRDWRVIDGGGEGA